MFSVFFFLFMFRAGSVSAPSNALVSPEVPSMVIAPAPQLTPIVCVRTNGVLQCGHEGDDRPPVFDR